MLLDVLEGQLASSSFATALPSALQQIRRAVHQLLVGHLGRRIARYLQMRLDRASSGHSPARTAPTLILCHLVDVAAQIRAPIYRQSQSCTGPQLQEGRGWRAPPAPMSLAEKSLELAGRVIC